MLLYLEKENFYLWLTLIIKEIFEILDSIKSCIGWAGDEVYANITKKNIIQIGYHEVNRYSIENQTGETKLKKLSKGYARPTDQGDICVKDLDLECDWCTCMIETKNWRL